MEHKVQTQPTSPSRRYSPPSTPKNLASGRRPRSRTTCGHDKFYKSVSNAKAPVASRWASELAIQMCRGLRCMHASPRAGWSAEGG